MVSLTCSPFFLGKFSVYYFEYELGNFIDFESDDIKRNQQIENFNIQLTTFLEGYKNEKEQDLQNLIFVNIDITPVIIDKSFKGNVSEMEDNNWGKIISILEKFECYSDIDFIKIISLAAENIKLARINKSRVNTQFLLESSKMYELSILQQSFIPKGRGDSSVYCLRTIDLFGDNEVCEIINGKITVSGKYDLYKFKVRTKSISSASNSDLILQINRDDDKKIPSLIIPIRIERAKYKKIIQIIISLVFIIGAFGLFFAEYICPNDLVIIRNISIILMALTAFDFRDFMKILLKSIGLFE